MVPFSSYAGKNSGIPIEPLMTAEFRGNADALFGFKGNELLARTAPGWLALGKGDSPNRRCEQVATAYRDAFA